MTIEGDTIAAIASTSGVGGVGIVRVSGPRAILIASAVVGRELERTAMTLGDA